MEFRLSAHKVEGKVTIPASKSFFQRIIAASLLSKQQSEIEPLPQADDVIASKNTAVKLGANIIEKNNKELLDREAQLRTLWDQVVDEATEQGIKAAEFPDFWLSKRAEAFPVYWVATPVQ